MRPSTMPELPCAATAPRGRRACRCRRHGCRSCAAARPLKRWRYVGVYGTELMLCAATRPHRRHPAGVLGGARPRERRLRERTSFTPRPRRASATGGCGRGRGVDVELALSARRRAGRGRQPATAASYIWTRKQPVRARGTRRDGRAAAGEIDAPGSSTRPPATTHATRPGTGRPASGRRRRPRRRVEPRHRRARRAERPASARSGSTAAARGRRRHVRRLTSTACASRSGERLRFTSEAERARRDDLRLFASDYAQPFGTFSGALPGGVELARGLRRDGAPRRALVGRRPHPFKYRVSLPIWAWCRPSRCLSEGALRDVSDAASAPSRPAGGSAGAPFGTAGVVAYAMRSGAGCPGRRHATGAGRLSSGRSPGIACPSTSTLERRRHGEVLTACELEILEHAGRTIRHDVDSAKRTSTTWPQGRPESS